MYTTWLACSLHAYAYMHTHIVMRRMCLVLSSALYQAHLGCSGWPIGRVGLSCMA